MRLLLLIAAVLFVLAPLDAQLWIVGAARWLWLEPEGRLFGAAFAGTLAAAAVAYNWIWNALSYSIYLADEQKAREAHQRRKR